MKILQACAVEFTFDHFISPLVDDLICSGHEVHASFGFDKGPSRSRLKLSECFFHDEPIRRSVSPANLVYSTFRAILLLRKHRYDVVHVHTPIASIVYRIASLFVPSSSVYYTVHGYYFAESQSLCSRYLSFFLELCLAPFQDITFFVSREDHIVSRLFLPGLPESKVFTGNGSNPLHFYPLPLEERSLRRKDISLSDDSIVLGYVGRMVSEKGVGLLLDAFERLVPNHPHLVLLLCGSRLESDHSASVDYKIVRLQRLHPRNLIVTGFVGNPSYWYQIMDLFCLPSFREGMPTSLIEAMLTNVIPVCTDIRGSREIVTHGVNGYLFPAGSSDDLCGTLSAALDLFDAGKSDSLVVESPRSTILKLGLTLDSVISRYSAYF